jgi:predicted hydrolase (HD superfamily)
MEKSKIVFEEVNGLYRDSATSMGKWMWYNHVQWVADKAKVLAEKYGANAEKAYCAALLHDLADSHYERDHKDFVMWSEEKGKEILLNAGFNEDEAREIVEIIIRPHSCQAGNMPTTKEGQILSTADAMFHLQTGFFPMLCYMHRPENAKTYEEWQEWFNEKIEREFNIKMFFENERAEVKPDYEALSMVFKKTTLQSRVS